MKQPYRLNTLPSKKLDYPQLISLIAVPMRNWHDMMVLQGLGTCLFYPLTTEESGAFFQN